MNKTEPVLVSISFVVNAPIGEPLSDDERIDMVQDDFLNAVADRLQASCESLKLEPWFESYQGVAYHYLAVENEAREENAGRCARCGRWTSDFNKPDFLSLLMNGETIEGELICSECLAPSMFASEETDLPQGDTFNAND